jgi:methylated-DNA-[protein]-cysteine S-methyltransferase
MRKSKSQVLKSKPSNQSLVTGFSYMNSPIGRLSILADEKGILEIRFPNNSADLPPVISESNEIVEQAIDQLHAYFDGRLKDFDIPLSLNGTDFQKGVWAQLRKIGFGRTASYGDIAAAIGNPKASRAVGMANNKNKIPIVIPCHRVIGSDGSLTGFAGGLDTKRWLLKHEGLVSII